MVEPSEVSFKLVIVRAKTVRTGSLFEVLRIPLVLGGLASYWPVNDDETQILFILLQEIDLTGRNQLSHV